MQASLPKPLIFGVSGPVLTQQEKDAFAQLNPLGFILFTKNLVNPLQSRKLCEALRQAVNRPNAPILVDQEGGSVNRLRPPVWREPPAPLELGKFAYTYHDNSLEQTAQLVKLNAQLIAYDLHEIGITFNCAPVGDLLIPKAHSITSTRSFGPDPHITSVLLQHMAMGLKSSGIQPIVKHLPGQGRGQCDSHLTLPVVSLAHEFLEQSDFSVFKKSKETD